jgi:hypothetical protein
MRPSVKLLSFYFNVPDGPKDIFLADPHKLFELSHDLSVTKNVYMSVEAEEFREIVESPDSEVIFDRMLYLDRLKQYAINKLGKEPRPEDLVVPANPPITDWQVECPFVVKKLHCEQAFDLLSTGVGNCGNALQLIRDKIPGLPSPLDIGQGQTFFTGKDGILSLIRKLSQANNPLDCGPIFTSLRESCPQFQGYIDWSSQPGFLETNPIFGHLYVNVGSSLTEIQQGVDLFNLISQFM